MGIIVLLICISVTIAVTFLGIFLWNMKSGQYDDTYTPSVRMLFEDKLPSKKETASAASATEREKVASTDAPSKELNCTS